MFDYRIHLRTRSGEELGYFLGVFRDGEPLCSKGPFSGKSYSRRKLAMADVARLSEEVHNPKELNYLVYEKDRFVQGGRLDEFELRDFLTEPLGG